MPQKLNPRILIVAGIVVLGLVLLVIVLLKGALSGKATPGNTNTGTGAAPTIVQGRKSVELPDPKAVPSIYQQTAEYLAEQKKMDLTIAPENEKSRKAGLLLEKVPYKGKLFTFDYSNKDLAFKVVLDKDRTLEANNEFRAWLKTQGVDDPSWLRDLKIEYN